MEKRIIQNGGKYSAELSKQCTHLICEVSEGDKFIVARKWGTIYIVTRKWFDQSLAKRVCMNEEAYPVQSSSLSSVSANRSKLKAKSVQDRNPRNSQSAMSSLATDSSLHAFPSVGNLESDLDISLSQHISNIASSDVSVSVEEKAAGTPGLPQNKKEPEGCITYDSETDDLYLSDCKLCLVGFDSSDTRNLLGMVRRGGGSRYMFFNDRLTHIVVGAPSDVEKRELRGLAALGVIRIVKRNWLEDCDREKKEVPVVQKHVAYDILLPKEAPPLSYKASVPSMSSSVQAECMSKISNPLRGSVSGNAGTKMPEEEVREDLVDNCSKPSPSAEIKRSSQSTRLVTAKGKQSSQHKSQLGDSSQHGKTSKVFAGRSFNFSHTFPKDKSDEVVQWINEGGGEILDSVLTTDADFIVECHGVIPSPPSCSRSTCVSSHWIMSCLKEGHLLDVSSHILYSPLPCRIPLPGFEGFRFCVSQYSDKERLLLHNLCFVLGAKFGEKLTKKVTHLLCKFANGPKYDAACKWGVRPVRCEWLYECVRQSKAVALDSFYPDEVPQDLEPGMCTVTQYPTQAAKLISTNNSSQISGESQDLRKKNNDFSRKRSRVPELSNKSNQPKKSSSIDELHKNAKEDRLPDVAAAIEDLLEQSSKIQDLKSPDRAPSETIFTPDCPVINRDHTKSHAAFGPPVHWLQSVGKGKDLQKASEDHKTGIHYNFSETQTESQLVGYEEDLSGRQMIIDRVRSSMDMT